MGSVGIYVKEEGALATGDTVYATDHELIDWYPGSSSHKMANSVEKILNFTREANVSYIPIASSMLHDSQHEFAG